MTHPLNGLGQQEPAEPPAPHFHTNNLNAQAFGLSSVEQQNLGALLQDSVPAPEADYGIGFHPNNLNAQAFQLSPTEEMHLAQLDNPSREFEPEPEPPEAPDVDLGELALDVTQIGLDVVGIIEPTPFADGANTIISAGRGDWLGAGLSLVGVVPYIGDLAKAGKVGKWAQTVAKAVDAATDSAAAARVLEPALRGLKEAVDTIPQGVLDSLPSSAREAIESMRTKLDDFFARSVDDAFENTPYTRAEYDEYVARKVDAGETPRSPDEYVEARDHWRRGGEAHAAAVEDAIVDLRLRYPEAEVMPTPSLRTADGDLTYPDLMVIDEEAGTLIFVEVKTGGADLTPNQRALVSDLENATFTPTQARELQIRPPDQTLGELFEDGIQWEEFRGPGYAD